MDRSKFFAALRKKGSGVFGTQLSQVQVDNLNILLDEAELQGLPLRHLAYGLATTYHEVGSAMKPISENLYYTTSARIKKTWPKRFPSVASAQPYVKNPQKLANKVYANRMGNGNEASGDGWRYRGRGYPQETGKDNAKRSSFVAGVDLVADPDKMLDPHIASRVMFKNMTTGAYTKKKFLDFLDKSPPDYVGARAIINADVEANGAKVARYAKAFEQALEAAGYGLKAKTSASEKHKEAEVIEPVAVPVAKDEQNFASEAVIKSVQQKLKDLGYTEVGGVDGKVGVQTKTAVLAFRNENGLEVNDAIDDALVLALETAPKRKLDRNVTPAVVRENAPETRTNWLVKIGAVIVGIPSLISAALDGVLSNLSGAREYIAPLKETFSDVPGWAWLCIMGGTALALFIIARHGERKGIEAYKTGERR